MSYRVTWGPVAEQGLAAVWLAASDRQAVTEAAASLDAELARDPLRLGVPLDSSVHRVAYHDPVGVEFEVVEDDKHVLVHLAFATG